MEEDDFDVQESVLTSGVPTPDGAGRLIRTRHQLRGGGGRRRLRRNHPPKSWIFVSGGTLQLLCCLLLFVAPFLCSLGSRLVVQASAYISHSPLFAATNTRTPSSSSSFLRKEDDRSSCSSRTPKTNSLESSYSIYSTLPLFATPANKRRPRREERRRQQQQQQQGERNGHNNNGDTTGSMNHSLKKENVTTTTAAVTAAAAAATTMPSGDEKKQSRRSKDSSVHRSSNRNSNNTRIRHHAFPDASARNYTTAAIPDRRNNSSTSSSLRNNKSSRRKNTRELIQETQRRQQSGTMTKPLTQEYCDYLLAECVSNDEWEAVLDVLEIMNFYGLRQVHSTYSKCLQACFEKSNAGSAKEILSAMKLAEIEPSSSDYTWTILAMCRNNNNMKHQERTDSNAERDRWWRQALKLVMSVPGLPITAYDAVLSCMAEERQWKDALRLLHFMETSSSSSIDTTTAVTPKPALSTYRIVIECCVFSNQAQQAAQVLQSCKETPTVYSFELVISALSRKLQWRRALQLLNRMEELGVPRTLQIYNSIISSCGKAKEVSMAKNLLVRMRRKDNLTPNIVSFNSCLTACANTPRHWRDALTILDQAHREPGVTPDVYTYTNVIRACAKGRKFRRALTLFQVVKDKGLPLDTYCYTAAIEACEWRQALALLKEMEEKQIQPSEVTYSVAIKACGGGGQWQKALDLLQTMRNKKLPINVYVYNAAITAVSKAAKQQSKNGVGDGSLWTEVMKLLEHMRQDGIEPDGFSFSSAISCCGAEGRWEEALELMEMMQKGGPKTRPNRVAYTAAIASCGRAGQVDHALRLFRQMIDHGLSADRVAYNALFSALRVAKKPDLAFDLWNEMLGYSSKKQNIQVPSSGISTSPDMITVTDAIAALSSGTDSEENRKKVDTVFAEAVRLGVVLSEFRVPLTQLMKQQMKENGVGNPEVDLSGFSFPVARAACRYVLSRFRAASGHETLVFITGTGASASGTTLQEYVPEVLSKDLGLTSTARQRRINVEPQRLQGIVEVDAATITEWITESS